MLFSIESHGLLWEWEQEEGGEEKHAEAAVCGRKERKEWERVAEGSRSLLLMEGGGGTTVRAGNRQF